MDVESSLWHAGLYTPTKVLPERYWGKKLLSLSYLLEKVWRNTMTSQKYQYWNNAWTDRRIWCEGKLYSETIGHLTFVYLILLNMDYGAWIFIMFQLYPQYTSWRGNYLRPASISLLFHYNVFLARSQSMSWLIVIVNFLLWAFIDYTFNRNLQISEWVPWNSV